MKPIQIVNSYKNKLKNDQISLELGTYPSKIFRRFSCSFEPLFDSKSGVIYFGSILPPDFEVEKRLKRTRKPTETFYLDRFSGP